MSDGKLEPKTREWREASSQCGRFSVHMVSHHWSNGVDDVYEGPDGERSYHSLHIKDGDDEIYTIEETAWFTRHSFVQSTHDEFSYLVFTGADETVRLMRLETREIAQLPMIPTEEFVFELFPSDDGSKVIVLSAQWSDSIVASAYAVDNFMGGAWERLDIQLPHEETRNVAWDGNTVTFDLVEASVNINNVCWSMFDEEEHKKIGAAYNTGNPDEYSMRTVNATGCSYNFDTNEFKMGEVTDVDFFQQFLDQLQG